jgi:hypothetical protein
MRTRVSACLFYREAAGNGGPVIDLANAEPVARRPPGEIMRVKA